MATTFNDLVDLVYTITNRPDLVAETEYAIRVATLKAHNSDEYIPDKVVALVTPVAAAETSTFEIDTTAAPFVRFRKELAVTNYPITQTYDLLDVTEVFDAYGYLNYNSYYRVGTSITIRALAAEQARVVYLQRPDVTTATYSSWIADTFPDMVAQGAASIIFDTTGKKDEQQRFNMLFLQGVRELQADYIERY